MNNMELFENLISMIEEIDVEKNDAETLREFLDYTASGLHLIKEGMDKAINLFYEKCRISQNGYYTFNEDDYKELDKYLKGEE